MTGFVVLLIGFAALHAVYPWSIHYGNFRFGWWSTMGSYLLVAVFLGILADACHRFARWRFQSPASRGIACGLLMLLSSAFLSILFGPGGINVPGTRIRGIFFSEWEFLSFIFYVAIPTSTVAAVVCGLSERRRMREDSRFPEIGR